MYYLLLFRVWVYFCQKSMYKKTFPTYFVSQLNIEMVNPSNCCFYASIYCTKIQHMPHTRGGNIGNREIGLRPSSPSTRLRSPPKLSQSFIYLFNLTVCLYFSAIPVITVGLWAKLTTRPEASLVLSLSSHTVSSTSFLQTLEFSSILSSFLRN